MATTTPWQVIAAIPPLESWLDPQDIGPPYFNPISLGAIDTILSAQDRLHSYMERGVPGLPPNFLKIVQELIGTIDRPPQLISGTSQAKSYLGFVIDALEEGNKEQISYWLSEAYMQMDSMIRESILPILTHYVPAHPYPQQGSMCATEAYYGRIQLQKVFFHEGEHYYVYGLRPYTPSSSETLYVGDDRKWEPTKQPLYWFAPKPPTDEPVGDYDSQQRNQRLKKIIDEAPRDKDKKLIWESKISDYDSPSIRDDYWDDEEEITPEQRAQLDAEEYAVRVEWEDERTKKQVQKLVDNAYEEGRNNGEIYGQEQYEEKDPQKIKEDRAALHAGTLKYKVHVPKMTGKWFDDMINSLKRSEYPNIWKFVTVEQRDKFVNDYLRGYTEMYISSYEWAINSAWEHAMNYLVHPTNEDPNYGTEYERKMYTDEEGRGIEQTHREHSDAVRDRWNVGERDPKTKRLKWESSVDEELSPLRKMINGVQELELAAKSFDNQRGIEAIDSMLETTAHRTTLEGFKRMLEVNLDLAWPSINLWLDNTFPDSKVIPEDIRVRRDRKENIHNQWDVGQRDDDGKLKWSTTNNATFSKTASNSLRLALDEIDSGYNIFNDAAMDDDAILGLRYMSEYLEKAEAYFIQANMKGLVEQSQSIRKQVEGVLNFKTPEGLSPEQSRLVVDVSIGNILESFSRLEKAVRLEVGEIGQYEEPISDHEYYAQQAYDEAVEDAKTDLKRKWNVDQRPPEDRGRLHWESSLKQTSLDSNYHIREKIYRDFLKGKIGQEEADRLLEQTRQIDIEDQKTRDLGDQAYYDIKMIDRGIDPLADESWRDRETFYQDFKYEENEKKERHRKIMEKHPKLTNWHKFRLARIKKAELTDEEKHEDWKADYDSLLESIEDFEELLEGDEEGVGDWGYYIGDLEEIETTWKDVNPELTTKMWEAFQNDNWPEVLRILNDTKKLAEYGPYEYDFDSQKRVVKQIQRNTEMRDPDGRLKWSTEEPTIDDQELLENLEFIRDNITDPNLVYPLIEHIQGQIKQIKSGLDYDIDYGHIINMLGIALRELDNENSGRAELAIKFAIKDIKFTMKIEEEPMTYDEAAQMKRHVDTLNKWEIQSAEKDNWIPSNRFHHGHGGQAILDDGTKFVFEVEDIGQDNYGTSVYIFDVNTNKQYEMDVKGKIFDPSSPVHGPVGYSDYWDVLHNEDPWDEDINYDEAEREKRHNQLMDKWKTSMAERTGDPLIDQAIEFFLADNPEVNSCLLQMSGMDNPKLNQLNHPGYASGVCGEVSRMFEEWCNEHDVEAYSYQNSYKNNHPFRTPEEAGGFHPEFWGYQDRSFDGYPGHDSTVIRGSDGSWFMVDFSAAQYGYKEFPMVQRLQGDAEGLKSEDRPKWEREWTSSTNIPSILYHWTESEVVDAIRQQGLNTSTGGLEMQHMDEPGVNLTTSGNIDEWNMNIYFMNNPVRLTIDTKTLDPNLFGPDLNSLLNEDTYPDEPDVFDSQHQTVENSLRFTGNIRYLAPIPASAIVAYDSFKTPSKWKLDDDTEGRWTSAVPLETLPFDPAWLDWKPLVLYVPENDIISDPSGRTFLHNDLIDKAYPGFGASRNDPRMFQRGLINLDNGAVSVLEDEPSYKNWSIGLAEARIKFRGYYEPQEVGEEMRLVPVKRTASITKEAYGLPGYHAAIYIPSNKFFVAANNDKMAHMQLLGQYYKAEGWKYGQPTRGARHLIYDPKTATIAGYGKSELPDLDVVAAAKGAGYPVAYIGYIGIGYRDDGERDNMIMGIQKVGSQVVHKFNDGWTIHKLDNEAERQAEGQYLNHQWGEATPTGQPTHLEHSLRDPRGQPQASFFELSDLTKDKNPVITEVLGPNGQPPAQEHMDRLHSWGEVGYPVERWRSYDKPYSYYSKEAVVEGLVPRRNVFLRMVKELPEDTSKVLHTFDNGWTIRQLVTHNDTHREGVLMDSSATPAYAHAQNDLYHVNPTTGFHTEEQYKDTLDQWLQQYGATEIPGFGFEIYSLRDNDNLPRATFSITQGQAHDVIGRNNQNTRFINMIEQWTGQPALHRGESEEDY